MSCLSGVKVSLAALTATFALTGSAGAVAITGPVDLSSFTAHASYGPAAPAHFAEPGPITVSSGTTTSLFTGPNYRTVDSLLLVISGAIPSGDVLTLTFGNLAPISFRASDFVSTSAAGFDSNIGGIANGTVNTASFASSLHAGADVTGLPGGLATDAFLASVTIAQTIATALRVDVFGDLNGTIVNNAANSGAFGITGSSAAGGTAVAVPEPGSLLLVGTALLVLGFTVGLRTKRRRRPERGL